MAAASHQLVAVGTSANAVAQAAKHIRPSGSKSRCSDGGGVA